jgi:hypothetical protein
MRFDAETRVKFRGTGYRCIGPTGTPRRGSHATAGPPPSMGNEDQMHTRRLTTTGLGLVAALSIGVAGCAAQTGTPGASASGSATPTASSTASSSASSSATA